MRGKLGMASDLILDKAYRAQVIEDIESDENVKRKEESLKRFEIYHDRLEEYIYNILRRDLSNDTVDDMRVISSINLCRRIVDEQSSIYSKRPDRMIHNSDEKTDKLFGNIYSLSRVNTAMKKANVAFNLQDQCLSVYETGISILNFYDVSPTYFTCSNFTRC